MLTNVRRLAAIAIPSFQGSDILGRRCFRLYWLGWREEAS
jgi:hypothetical protein